ncbi:uncharacterized protein C8Q71DRAFT_714852 [Rhodofomes roseus]|uniref:Distal membrane-arm assembly complex protein 1-like domain-containing protein n=1 Tax=Rhodofomes roseus TaxID=34475 RepID=A0ABQ8K557_9APHY|nr:uncharacterized protein C8Q71DRAFT_714852 [Rhodofomes roseus]KAH9831778.1 hypothetical protein C8Q71DRAFT_714852 [Rhodofomes roseus]
MQSISTPERTSHGAPDASLQAEAKYQDCLACRIIGSAALAGLGVHSLNQSRAHQPGTPMGKRIMAGLGICFLAGSYLRWTK